MGNLTESKNQERGEQISREEQDAFAAASHQNAARAWKADCSTMRAYQKYWSARNLACLQASTGRGEQPAAVGGTHPAVTPALARGSRRGNSAAPPIRDGGRCARGRCGATVRDPADRRAPG